MSDIEQRVLDETLRFRKALPELMKSYARRWVIFRDGAVIADFGSVDDAYATAIARFGIEGGFVVAPVVEAKPTPVTAGVLFGMP